MKINRKDRISNQDEAVRDVERIYQDLAERPIDRNCTLQTECCQFRRTKIVPFITKGEALLAAKAVRAAGHREMPESIDGACPLLNARSGKCMIYKNRPFGCRTHFCDAAGGPYTRAEVLDLIRRLEVVDSKLLGHGPVNLPVAVKAALAEFR
jgi:uncharacterized protein